MDAAVLTHPSAVPRLPISSRIPPLVLGTATFNIQHVKDPLKMPYRQIVSRSLELGVNGFDTSPYYGPSESLLGDALAAHVATHGTPRESYVLITKAGRIGPKSFDYSPTQIRQSVLRSLRRLNTSYLDLVYLHDVEFVTPDEVLEALQMLRQLKAEGLVHYVGISGFPIDVLCSLSELILAETGIPLDAVLSYGQFTIQNPQLGLPVSPDHMGAALSQSPLERFKEAGVEVVSNASMLGMGLLTQTGVSTGDEPEAAGGRSALIAKWHPSPIGLRLACRQLATIAEAEGYRLEDVALRWSMENYARIGALAGVGVELPGSHGIRVGPNVMGVATVDELERTVQLWEEIAQAQQTPALGSDPSSGDTTSAAGEGEIDRLVREKMWPALAEWKGYTWASPEPGFKNETQAVDDWNSVKQIKL
ncbi:D-arabinose 1-dehydrogenase [Paramyrothecium foliicola]|nr:D-arabinose 1-dehydrogenase [Paramyrothecium foliicola]